MLLATDAHLGTKNVNFQMERYGFKRRADGIYIINLRKTWEKLMMAAMFISARPYGHRAVLKFAHYIGAQPLIQKSFTEPRLLILTDPRTDHQPIKEASLGNIPTIAFCDTDSPMPYVDIGIPANNKGKNSIGRLIWMLARMVLQMRGTILPGHKWDVMVDLFFYRDPEETKDQEVNEGAGPVPDFGVTEYGGGVPAVGVDVAWEPAVAPVDAAVDCYGENLLGFILFSLNPFFYNYF
ncbi:hypothetical protein MKX03_004292 [Papaver bracteatum]|nr:hypothetical protein MKX03_004292 [Papaver bracteatum]